MPSHTTLLGAAGEHFVMSELLRRGFIAALAPHGVPNTDVVVTDVESTHLCSIQVKTRRDIGSDGGWHMKAKHEQIKGSRLFYCFVDFGKEIDSRPNVHVIPATVVAETLKITHQEWLIAPGKNGRPHKDGDMRRLLPNYAKGGRPSRYTQGWLDQYRDAWHLLRLKPTTVEQE